LYDLLVKYVDRKSNIPPDVENPIFGTPTSDLFLCQKSPFEDDIEIDLHYIRKARKER